MLCLQAVLQDLQDAVEVSTWDVTAQEASELWIPTLVFPAGTSHADKDGL